MVNKIEKLLFGEAKIDEHNPRFELTVSDKRKEAALEILRNKGADLTKKIIAFCPGSTNSRAKRWHAESYAALNDKLQAAQNASIFLIGSKEEIEVSRDVAEKSLLKPIILTGETTLSELTAILSVCDLLVSNDTGPAHIASAFGTKTLAIFGPTNPQTTRPINAEIIRKNVECAPCMLRDCPIDHRCMTQISPDEVFEKAQQILIAD